MRARFISMQDRYPLIGDVRGLGAMLGVELVRDRQTKEPAKDACSAIVSHCLENGVVIAKAGIYSNVLRMLVALVISDDQLAEGLDVLEEAVRVVSV